jgi:two-component system cell cycle response regulator
MSENIGAKQRLLIVDDSKVIRVTARKILQNHFATVEAVDGTNAWEILNAGPAFSLVVSDLTMPNLDGFGLLEKIRSSHQPDISDLPVIIITGANDSESTMQRARAAGATDFIGKPFDAVHLLARTQAHANAYVSRRSLKVHALSLEDQSLVDTQTGLANEAAFMDRGYQQLSYAIRHNSRFALAQIEIDHFGDLFKQHGKTATDMVIKYAATVLESGIRQEDMAARIGAARFAMLLPGMDQAGIHRLTDRISSDIRNRTVKYGNGQIHFTVSIGIAAPAIEQDTRLEMLLNAAGNSLRDAIIAGGDRVVIHESESTTPPTTATNISRHMDSAAIADIIAETAHYSVNDGGVETELVTITATTLADSVVAQLPEVTAEPAINIEAVTLQEPDIFPVIPTAQENTAPNHHDDEEILITSPYDLFGDLRETDTAADSSGPWQIANLDPLPKAQAVFPVTPATLLQPVMAESAPSAAEELAEIPEIIPDQPRSGLFRRLLALFTRSRQYT